MHFVTAVRGLATRAPVFGATFVSRSALKSVLALVGVQAGLVQNALCAAGVGTGMRLIAALTATLAVGTAAFVGPFAEEA